MNLTENIEKQIDAGFSKQEIYQNLIHSGHSKEQIDVAFPSEAVLQEKAKNESVSTKSIVFGCLFLFVVIFRVARFANSGSVLLFISIFTGLGLAIYYFTRKG